MSGRAAAIDRFGREQGDKLYRRFHSLRTKARLAGVPFHWRSFDGFYRDLMAIVPPDFDPKQHRFKFNLKLKNASGLQVGYAPSTMLLAQAGEPRGKTITKRSAEETARRDRWLIDMAFKVSDAFDKAAEEGTEVDFEALIELAAKLAPQGVFLEETSETEEET